MAALVLPASASPAAPGKAQSQVASALLSGTATSSTGRAVGFVIVRLRSMETGRLLAVTTSSASGAFTFTPIGAGTYVVEVVSIAGQIAGTSAALSVAAGAVVTGVTVTTVMPAAAVAAGGAAGGAAAGAAGGAAGSTAAGGASFLATTAGVVTTVAGNAAIAAVTLAEGKPEASPSK